MSTKLFRIMWYVVTAVLAVAPFVERTYGTDFAHTHIYGSLIFLLLWVLTILSGVVAAIRHQLWKRRVLFQFPIAALWILMGSVVSFFGSQENQIVGQILTYIGFAWFVIAYLLFLLKKDGPFRALLKRFSLIAILILSALPLLSQRCISSTEAALLGELAVEYDGRIAPLQTLCDDWCIEVSGKSHWDGMNSVQVAMGWLLHPEEWLGLRWLKVPVEDRKELAVGRYAAPMDFFTADGVYRWRDSDTVLPKSEKSLALLQQMRSGLLFRVIPYGGRWYTVADLPADAPDTLRQMASQLFYALAQPYHDVRECVRLLEDFAAMQSAQISEVGRLRMEYYYSRVRPWVSSGYGTLFCAFCLLMLWIAARRQGERRIITVCAKILRVVLLFVCVVLWVQWLLRWYLAGHVPLGSGYDTMLLWVSLLMMAVVWVSRRSLLAAGVGSALAGIFLIVMNFPFNTPRLMPLTAALNTPWLSLHVSVVMAAYAGLALTFVLSVVYCIGCRYLERAQLERLTDLSRLLLMPSWGLLAIGIMLGSVWGAQAWGSYWSWDPKEVWALVTAMLYGPAVFPELFRRLSAQKNYQLYVLLAFAALLMTYLGVNFLFGGLHSYL